MLQSPRYVGRRPVEITGPRTDKIGRLAAGLAIAYHLKGRPAGAYVTAYRESRPDLLAVGAAIIEAGLFGMAERHTPWAEAAPVLMAAV